ncbi:hypothetical protein [Deinococcus sp. YIM 77859]|uniref:hypothetical protein n=1 Tax=Deinococcus sp. YIM 77859 TaxID=1540221 RepID=UPI000B1601EC|nr:hypothetical protein [Deinococcus sp. YIM 77859]
MRDNAEHILMTSLAAYGLLKIIEGFLSPPRPRVIVVDGDATDYLRDLLQDPEDAE